MIDWTLSINSFINGGILLAIIVGILRVGGMQELLKHHADTLEDHGDRMTKHDEIMLKMVSDLQRLIGRVEADAFQDRRQLPR